MLAVFRKKRWSPYVAGAGIGVLSWVTFGLMNEALGTSTTFVRVVGIIESWIAPGHVASNPYLAKYIVENPPVEWQMLLVIGLFIGAFVSAKLSGDSRVEHVPEVWASRFGRGRWTRYTGAFLGGVLVLFGARMAGGCTSGHGISGGLQLSVSSWLFFGSFFVAGIGTAFVLFGKEGRNHV
jgi:uncharacterized membrane protein YedE/YeeE